MIRRFPCIGGLCALMLSPMAWLVAQAGSLPEHSPVVMAIATPSTVSPTWPRADTLVLTLAEAQQRAVTFNPWYLASREDVAVARGEQRQARLPRFNPDVFIGMPGLASGVGPEYEFSLTQELEVAGQRGLRSRTAGLGVDRARALVLNSVRLVVAEASIAWYRTFAAQRRRELAERQFDLTGRLLDAVRIQAREGDISTMEANLAEIEAGRARTRLLAARRESSAAELELKRVTGMSVDQELHLADATVLPTLPDPATLSEDSLVRHAVAARADLAAGATAVREADAQIALIRRETLPNLRASLLARRDPGEGSPRFGLGLGLTLPFLNRNQGMVAQHDALARQARHTVGAIEAQVRTEVVTALRAFRTATEEVTVFTTSVLEAAQRHNDMLETAYQAGKIALPTLLLLRNQLLDAQQEYWASWLAQREAWVALEAAIQATALPDPEQGTPSSQDRHDITQEDAR